MTDDLLERLRETVGGEHVLADEADMAAYVVDWTGAYPGRALAVVRPGSTAEVAAVVTACHAAGVAIVPQGGNTGLVAGGVPDASGTQVVLSLGRMRKIRDVDPVAGTITVEAGVVLADVQAAAAEAGRLFPMSLGSEGSCTIGGNLATNAGGTAVLRYGMTRELTLGLEVVLPDGRVWEGLRGLRKDNTGYSLKDVFIGSEGTLGVITAAVLRLFPPTPARATAWVSVADVASAVTLLGLMQAHAGAHLATFEIVNRTALDLVLTHLPGSHDPAPGAGADWSVLVELAGTVRPRRPAGGSPDRGRRAGARRGRRRRRQPGPARRAVGAARGDLRGPEGRGRHPQARRHPAHRRPCRLDRRASARPSRRSCPAYAG